MKSTHLDKMIKGWFIGNFTPTAFSTESCEVAVKNYKSGDYEKSHFHKISTEITLILSGRVQMIGKEWKSGEIIVLSPGDITDFKAITDSVTVVVKIPSSINDKYFI